MVTYRYRRPEDVLPKQRSATWSKLRPLLRQGRRVLMSAEVHQLLHPEPAWLPTVRGTIAIQAGDHFTPRRGDVLVNASTLPALPDTARSGATVLQVQRDQVLVVSLADALKQHRALFGSRSDTSCSNYRRVSGLRQTWRLTSGAPSAIVDQLVGMGFVHVRRSGMAPWRSAGVDTEAIAFLDGGISVAIKDGFVPEGLNGCSVVGAVAMTWLCRELGFRRPSGASEIPVAELAVRLERQSRQHRDDLTRASMYLRCATRYELALAEVEVPDLLGWAGDQ